MSVSPKKPAPWQAERRPDLNFSVSGRMILPDPNNIRTVIRHVLWVGSDRDRIDLPEWVRMDLEEAAFTIAALRDPEMIVRELDAAVSNGRLTAEQAQKNKAMYAEWLQAQVLLLQAQAQRVGAEMPAAMPEPGTAP